MTEEEILLNKVTDFFELCLTVEACTEKFFLTLKSSERIYEMPFNDLKNLEPLFGAVGARLDELYSAIRNLPDGGKKITLVVEILRRINNYLKYQRTPRIGIADAAKDALKSLCIDPVLSTHVDKEFSGDLTNKVDPGPGFLQERVTTIVITCIKQFRDSLLFLKVELQLLSRPSTDLIQTTTGYFPSDQDEKSADRAILAFCKKLVSPIQLVDGDPYKLLSFFKKQLQEDIVFIWLGTVTQFSFLFHELKAVPPSTLNFFKEGGVTPWTDYVLPHFQRRNKKKNKVVDFTLDSVRCRHFPEHKPIPENCRELESLIAKMLIRKA